MNVNPSMSCDSEADREVRPKCQLSDAWAHATTGEGAAAGGHPQRCIQPFSVPSLFHTLSVNVEFANSVLTLQLKNENMIIWRALLIRSKRIHLQRSAFIEQILI